MTKLTDARSMLEARIHQILDDIEAKHADDDDDYPEGNELVLDWMAMMYEVMGRIVGLMPDSIERERCRVFAYTGVDWVFSHAVETALKSQAEHEQP